MESAAARTGVFAKSLTNWSRRLLVKVWSMTGKPVPLGFSSSNPSALAIVAFCQFWLGLLKEKYPILPLTIWLSAERFEHVGCLAGPSFGLSQHVGEKTHLAEHTVFVYASSSCVMQGKVTYEWREVKNLKERVCIRVDNVCL